jgi:hypothetical protein
MFFYMEYGQALGNRLFFWLAKAMSIRPRSTSRLFDVSTYWTYAPHALARKQLERLKAASASHT